MCGKGGGSPCRLMRGSSFLTACLNINTVLMESRIFSCF